MSYWDTLDEQARHVQTQTTTQNAREVTLLRDAVSLCVEATQLDNPQAPTDAVAVSMSLISQNLNSLKVCLDIVTSGHYVQCGVLLRHIYENWLAIQYIRRFPMEAGEWLNCEWDHKAPSVKKILAAIGHAFGANQTTVGDSYGLLSKFAHPNAISIAPQICQQPAGTVIDTGLVYHHDRFLSMACLVAQYIGFLLVDLVAFVEFSDPWCARFHETEGHLVSFIKDHQPEVPAQDDTGFQQ